MQILLQFCLHESVQILAYISTLFIYYIFYQRRLLGTRLLPRKLCKNLRGSGVTRVRVKAERYTGHKFWPTSDQVKNLHTLPFKNLHGSAGTL